MKIRFLWIVLLFFLGCEQETMPKPYGNVRLQYPTANYTVFKSDCPFEFQYSTLAEKKPKDSLCDYNIYYPNLKATIYLTYENVPRDGVIPLLQDAEKSVYEPHTARATYIEPKLIIRKKDQVYGTLYELGGESAMNFQFHLTDSANHFLRGAVYFRTHPKPDSLQPAAQYLKKDVETLMETLRWK